MKENSECGGCGSKEKLHHFRHRGNYRRLCTSCVLKHNIGSFCPHCFEIYEGFTPPVDRVACLKCDSPSHLGCVGKDIVTRYLCPSCSNPGHVYFDVGGFKKKISYKDGIVSSSHKIIETKSAKILLAACQFSAVSMRKAASSSKIEAEKRVKESWLAKKRAKEGLEELYTVSSKQPKKDGKGLMPQIQSIPIPIPSPVVVEEPMPKPRGNSAVAAAVAAQKRIQAQASMSLIERKDSKFKPGGFHASHVLQRPPTNGVQPAVVNNDKLKVSPAAVMGDHQQFRNAASVDGKDKSLNISQLRINDAKVEDEKNVLPVVSKTEGLLQHSQISHPIKDGPDDLKEFGDSPMPPQRTLSNEDVDGVIHTGSSKTMS